MLRTESGRAVSHAALLEALLERQGVEAEVQPGARPKTVLCGDCRVPVRVGKTGTIPLLCAACRRKNISLRGADAKRARGQCTSCGSPAKPGRTKCAPCTERGAYLLWRRYRLDRGLPTRLYAIGSGTKPRAASGTIGSLPYA